MLHSLSSFYHKNHKTKGDFIRIHYEKAVTQSLNTPTTQGCHTISEPAHHTELSHNFWTRPPHRAVTQPLNPPTNRDITQSLWSRLPHRAVTPFLNNFQTTNKQNLLASLLPPPGNYEMLPKLESPACGCTGFPNSLRKSWHSKAGFQHLDRSWRISPTV